MPPSKRPVPPPALLRLPVAYQVGGHVLRIVHVAEGRWTVSVDDGPPSQLYATQTDAWEAGVRSADALDRARSP